MFLFSHTTTWMNLFLRYQGNVCVWQCEVFWLCHAGNQWWMCDFLVHTDNEVDGFSLFNMTEEDIFRMLPGKVGPARKIVTLIKNQKRRLEEKDEPKGGLIVVEVDEGVPTPSISSSKPATANPVNDAAVEQETSNYSRELSVRIMINPEKHHVKWSLCQRVNYPYMYKLSWSNS